MQKTPERKPLKLSSSTIGKLGDVELFRAELEAVDSWLQAKGSSAGASSGSGGAPKTPPHAARRPSTSQGASPAKWSVDSGSPSKPGEPPTLLHGVSTSVPPQRPGDEWLRDWLERTPPSGRRERGAGSAPGVDVDSERPPLCVSVPSPDARRSTSSGGAPPSSVNKPLSSLGVGAGGARWGEGLLFTNSTPSMPQVAPNLTIELGASEGAPAPYTRHRGCGTRGASRRPVPSSSLLRHPHSTRQSSPQARSTPMFRARAWRRPPKPHFLASSVQPCP
eukprot:7383375-Prymnesium_polylepis.1